MAIGKKTGIQRSAVTQPVAQPLPLLSDQEKEKPGKEAEERSKKTMTEYLAEAQKQKEESKQKHKELPDEEQKKARWAARQEEIVTVNQTARNMWTVNATEVVEFVTSIEASQKVKDSIGTANMQELSNQTKSLKDTVRNATTPDSPQIFQKELERFKEWCDKKAKTLENSTFNKIGSFLTSAVKFIHYSIHEDKEKITEHKAKMSQISQELSGKIKSFSDTSSSEPRKQSFVEKLAKENSHPNPSAPHH